MKKCEKDFVMFMILYFHRRLPATIAVGRVDQTILSTITTAGIEGLMAIQNFNSIKMGKIQIILC